MRKLYATLRVVNPDWLSYNMMFSSEQLEYPNRSLGIQCIPIYGCKPQHRLLILVQLQGSTHRNQIIFVAQPNQSRQGTPLAIAKQQSSPQIPATNITSGETVQTHLAPIAMSAGIANNAIPQQIAQNLNNQLPQQNPNQNSQVVTPVKVEALKQYITGYEFDSYLLEGFTHGFRIGYEGARYFRTSPNLPSSKEFPQVITDTLNNEVLLNRVKGPFPSPPFPHLQVSPIGCVPKKNPGEFRMIHHLSYPKENSINDFICEELATTRYARFDDAAKLLVQLGKSSLMAKTDIEAAYRLVPIHSLDHELLGIRWNNQYFYDTCLPFGASSSCAIFERFSSGLQYIAEMKLNINFMVHILDDFLILGSPNSSQCLDGLTSFLNLCKEIGVPIKFSKTEYPTTVLTFMGLVLDSDLMEARLPNDKLEKLRILLSHQVRSRKITLKNLQSLIGLLNFCCSVVLPGRCFLRRLIDLTIGVSSPSHYITLNKEARKDIRAWQIFVEEFNGRSLLLDSRWLTSKELHLYTDAAGSCGYAAIFKSHWFSGLWSPTHAALNITFQEMLPIVLAFELWGEDLANKCISLHSDNMAVVCILNKQTSKDKQVMSLVRHFVLSCMRHNILTKAVHIPGIQNTLPDLLSRLQVEKFHQLAPEMDLHPIIIPTAIKQKFQL